MSGTSSSSGPLASGSSGNNHIDKVCAILALVSSLIENLLFSLVGLYDKYVYNPLQVTLTPHCLRISRHWCISQENLLNNARVKNSSVLVYIVREWVIPLLKTLESHDLAEESGEEDVSAQSEGERSSDVIRITIFSANVITYSRTLLFVPVGVLLKYSWCFTAFLFVVLHDFLDHLDGIVAKCQNSTKKYRDDPVLGCFLDAFCDKIVNVFCFWTILMLTTYTEMSLIQRLVFVRLLK